MHSDGGSVGDACAGVVERLRARRGELVREIFERMRGDAFEHAGEDDAEYLVGLRAAITGVGGGVLLAVGEPAQEVEGWRLSHRQAQAALLVALRSPRPRG